jgi:hypothetical protein
VCKLSRPTAGLRPGSPLAAFIPPFVPGWLPGAWGEFAPGSPGPLLTHGDMWDKYLNKIAPEPDR